MKWLKKFWIGFVAAMPLSAWGLNPVILGGLMGLAGLMGVSVWRSVAPVNMQEAFTFFSSCWTCQIFSDIMLTMSNILPGIYKSLGYVIIPMAASLLAVFMAWRLFSGFLNNKLEEASKITGNFGTYAVRLTLLIGLLLMPLPRLMTNVFIEPALNLGTSLDYIVSDNDEYLKCMVATAVADPVSGSKNVAEYGAFSPSLRHQLACEIANVHQVTGLGFTVGWTFLNMAFNREYMYSIAEHIPIFPNVGMALVGGLVLFIYLCALLPIPLYFLEIFIKLSMDLIMLPLMLMSWMFDDDNFAIFPKGGQTIRKMIEDVIQAIVGIALTIVCLSFSVLFINAAFRNWSGANILQQAITNGDSKAFIDALMMSNDSLITIILMGVFIAMFMTLIPQLTNMLFKIQISDKYYQTAKKDLDTAWKNVKKWGSALKK